MVEATLLASGANSYSLEENEIIYQKLKTCLKLIKYLPNFSESDRLVW